MELLSMPLGIALGNSCPQAVEDACRLFNPFRMVLYIINSLVQAIGST